MRIGTTVSRILAAVLMISALVGGISGTAAQDSGDIATPSDASSIYVGVSCAADDEGSSCSFTPVDGSGGDVTGITVPTELLCAPVSSTSGTVIDAGIQQALETGQSLSISFDGVAYPSETATYTVETASGPIAAPGDGLACDAPDDATVEATEPPVEDVPDDEVPTDGEAAAAATQETGEVTQADDSGSSDVDPVDVTVTITAWDCPDVPVGGDTSACTPSQGVQLTATIDGTATTIDPTDVTGTSSVVAPEASELIVSEDWGSIPTGYSPFGDGVAVLTVSPDQNAITFIHLATPIVGRLQIVNGSCPTSGESRTEFQVIEPKSVAIAAAPACQATGGTVFTISGGSLESAIQVTTGSDGAWRGFLPAGTYTVTDDSGASADVRVIVDDISVVIAVDYVSHPLGVLNISRFACKDPNPTGVTISFEGSQPTFGKECAPTDSEIQIDILAEVSAASVTTVTLGADGVEEVELEPGSYTLTDLTSGVSSSFTIKGGVRVWAVVRDVILGGDGVGETGGNGNPGGGDGTGNPGTWSPGGNDGEPDTGAPGGPSGGTDGDVDAGDNSAGYMDDDTELLNVTALPDTGTRATRGGQTADFLAVLAMIGTIGVGAAAAQRARSRRAA